MLLDTSKYASARPHILTVLTAFMKGHTDNYEDIFTRLPSNSDVKNYMARMGFYKQTSFDVEYPFAQYDSTGRFLELTSFNESNSDSVINKLTRIFASTKLNLPPGMQRALAFSFSELIDNCCCHSLSEIENHICAQVFNDRVEICIVDNGIGIPESLKAVKKYADLNNRQLISKSILEKVTSKGESNRRSHQGFGLYAVNEIIRLNNGCFEIYSDDVALITRSGKTSVVKIPHWQGTIVYMTLRKTHDVFKWQGIWKSVFESRGYDKPYLAHIDEEDDFF